MSAESEPSGSEWARRLKTLVPVMLVLLILAGIVFDRATNPWPVLTREAATYEPPDTFDQFAERRHGGRCLPVPEPCDNARIERLFATSVAPKDACARLRSSFGRWVTSDFRVRTDAPVGDDEHCHSLDGDVHGRYATAFVLTNRPPHHRLGAPKDAFVVVVVNLFARGSLWP